MPIRLYRRRAADGALIVDEGLGVSRLETLIEHLLSVGVRPETMYCDRFLLGTLQDAVAGRWPVVDRVVTWSEATVDITAFRRLVADGPLSIAPEARALARVSLSQGSGQVRRTRLRPNREEAPRALSRRRGGRGHPCDGRSGTGAGPASGKALALPRRGVSRRHPGSRFRLDLRRWQATRRAAFERDSWRCTRCRRSGRLARLRLRPTRHVLRPGGG